MIEGVPKKDDENTGNTNVRQFKRGHEDTSEEDTEDGVARKKPRR